MIGRVCLLLEVLSVIVCLHRLYGERFKLDIKTISFLAVDMIIMEYINHYGLSKSYTMIIYPIIIIYSGIRFGFKGRALIVNNILYMVIISGIQLVVSLIYGNIFNVHTFKGIELLLVNIIVFVIVVSGIPKNKCYKLSLYLQDKGRILIVSLTLSIIITIVCLVRYKVIDVVDLSHSAVLIICIILICVLTSQLGKYRIKSKEIETELKMHELYAESFKSLIENVRMRQHEFDNHLNTISNMYLLCNSFDELVEMQQIQCKELKKDNRYNKLLKNDNQIIRGFLYTNFLKAEKSGIKVSYELVLDKLDIKMPVYKLVEVLGDLINNAIEAMEEEEVERRLHVSIIEVEDRIEIDVRNTSKVIPRSDISRFFEKGYSQKGENRGLGLYNVKKICDEYGFNISCDNKVVDNLNWITFMIY